MKKGGLSLFFCLMLVIVVLTGLVACSSTTTTQATSTTTATTTATTTTIQTTTSTATTTTTSTTQVKPIQLKFSTSLPEVTNIAKLWKEWAQRISDQSNGRLQIQLYFSASLLSQADTIRGLQTGQADIAQYNIGTNTGLLPLMEMTRLPFIGLPPLDEGATIVRQLIQDFPEINKEFNDLGLTYVAIGCYTPEQFFFTDKEVRLPSELKGLKIIGRGYWPQVLEGTGVALLSMGMEDWYTSLERGLADGQIINYLGSNAFKTLELLKYHTIIGEAGGSMVVGTLAMNTEVLNNLPADLKQILLDNCKWYEPQQATVDAGDEQMGKDFAIGEGHTFIELTPDEIAQWRDLAKPLHEQYIQDNSAAGPLQAIYDEMENLIQQAK